MEKHNLTDLPIPNQWKWVTKQPGKKRKIPTPSPNPTPTPDNASTPVPTKETPAPKEVSTPDIMKFAVPGMSPKFPAKDIKDLKEGIKTVAPAKDANASSILKFAKPGITPSFPVISPKPVKATEQGSPLCSTPNSVLAGISLASTPNTPGLAKPAANAPTDTPKRQSKKQINRSSLFNKTAETSTKPMDTSTNENDEDDCVVMKMELLKPDKNQPTMKQMFTKKPATPTVKKPVAKKSTPVAKKSTPNVKKLTPVVKQPNTSVVKAVAKQPADSPTSRTAKSPGASISNIAAKLQAFAANKNGNENLSASPKSVVKPKTKVEKGKSPANVKKTAKSIVAMAMNAVAEKEKPAVATATMSGQGTEESPMEID